MKCLMISSSAQFGFMEKYKIHKNIIVFLNSCVLFILIQNVCDLYAPPCIMPKQFPVIPEVCVPANVFKV